ncbi:MAG: phosphotransferase [Actinomycetota bacterium]|nr:phosphotransferase [Actinomycetota bacterium]
MTDALAASFPGAVVADAQLALRDDGTNRRARFRLSYADGEGPATVFLKASDLDHAALNAATGGLFNEAKLFRTGAHLPVDHPQVHHVVIDEPKLDFILVMEDVVARGADPRDATRPLTVEQAEHGVRALARLHSAYWGHRLRSIPELSWVEPFTATYELARGIEIGKDKVGDLLPPEIARLSGTEIDDLWHRFVPTVTTGEQTLLHGDPHIGNTYVCPDDDIGFLDWQVVHEGHPSLDLAYFVQGALTIEDRRAAEPGLIDAYLENLDLPVDERPERADLWLRYRAAASYGMALWLATAASRWQRREVSIALASRYAQAAVDLDATAAVGLKI